VVVLAGPNGGGKSRVLQLLQVANAEAGANRLAVRAEAERQLHQYQELLSRHERGSEEVPAQEVEGWKASVKLWQQKLARLDSIQLEGLDAKIVSFVPKALQLQDPLQIPPSEVLRLAEGVKDADGNSLQSSALPYIQRLQDWQREATHPDTSWTEQQRNEAIDNYTTLCRLIEELLQTKLSRSKNGEGMIFGKTLGSSLLSEGQKVLLQLAVAVHPSRDDSGLVLVMDEPENHLHPQALIFVLDRIRKTLPRAQLWIATHSVPLLAHLYSQSPECLHFVCDGSVTFAGRKPEVVLEGLLGNEDERARLLNFLDLPYALAATQFAAACLQSPEVAEHRPDDVQERQIRDIVFGKIASRPIKILDFGAGKGRLLGGMAEKFLGRDTIDYVALDASDANRTLCERQIESVYGSSARRWYSDIDALIADHGQEAFDVVVMCNVLHEIAPAQWLSVLGPSGVVCSALCESGSLLIVEDLRIPVGELPNASGFFLLDTEHLQKLFKAEQTVSGCGIASEDAKGDGRLKAHLIPRKCVAQADEASRRSAIEALQVTARCRLHELRSARDPSYKAGHMHSLWSQLYTNCGLFLEYLDIT
jgi:energy-coupling factor transporter ATP-binding protein EcfA2/SAM-dependent methyltransferase